MLDDRAKRGFLATPLTLLTAAALTSCASSRGMKVESGPSYEATRVPAGTEFVAQLEDRLSVRDSHEGEEFHATVDEPIVHDGETVVPAGALIHGRVSAVHQSTGGDDPNVLKLNFYRIDIRGQSYPLTADLTEAHPKTDTGEDLAKVAAGTAAGAVIGGIIGGDVKSAAIGAAVGAAAGTAVALGTRDEEAVLERDSKIKLELTEPIELR